jgi:sugar/nucleoside kinase (ribokinase family)
VRVVVKFLREEYLMKKVLIIGSVHLDIVGEFQPRVKDRVDKEGALKFSVGGAAYNIAANLSYKGFPVTVFSYLRENSISTEAIKSALHNANIDTRYISEDPDLSESGYISHALSGNLVSAVSAMSFQEKAFDEKETKKLDKAVREHELVVIDTNLTTGQIEKVLEVSKKHSRPIFVCNVSDSKCHRIVDTTCGNGSECFTFVSLNEKELATVFDGIESLSDEMVCSKFNSETVLVTHGSRGYKVYSLKTENRYQGSPVPVSLVKSELGAGDALFSAIVSHHLENSTINWRDCEQTINEYVGRILKTDGATPEGLINNYKPSAKGENKQSVIALGSSLVSAALTVGGFFLANNIYVYALLFLFIPFLSGISGAFIRHLLGKAIGITKNILTNIALGGVAGLLVSFTFFLSHWSTLGKSIESMLSSSGVPDNMRPILGFLFVSAFVAGLAVEVAFEKTEKKNLDRMLT